MPSRSQNADIIGDDVGRTITQPGRTAQDRRRGDVPLDMTARSNVELIVITVVVPAYARNYGELVLDRVGIFGIGAYLVLLTVEIPGSGGIQPRRRVEQRLVKELQMRLHADDQRMTEGEIVVVHHVQRNHVVRTVVIVEPEVGPFAEAVVIGHESDVRTKLVLLVLVIDTGTDRHTEFEVGVQLAVLDLRAVHGPLVPVGIHLFTHRSLVVLLTAQAIFRQILEAPPHLRSVVSRIKPAVCNRSQAGFRQIHKSVAVVVHVAQQMSIQRSVQQEDRR